MPLDLAEIRERWAPFAEAFHLGGGMCGGDRLFCGTREIARSQDSAYDLRFRDEAAEAAVCAAPVDIAALIAEVEHLRATSALVSSRAPEWAMNLASAHLSRETDGSHYGNVVDLAKLLDSVRTSDAPTEVARLEWIREYDDYTLRLTAGEVQTDLCYIGPASCMGQKYREVKSAPGVEPKLEAEEMHLPEAVARISAWAAENLPYTLPSFPFGD